jgi:hypothetical protein
MQLTIFSQKTAHSNKYLYAVWNVPRIPICSLCLKHVSVWCIGLYRVSTRNIYPILNKTDQSHLVPRLRAHWAIPPLPHIPSWLGDWLSTGTNLTWESGGGSVSVVAGRPGFDSQRGRDFFLISTPSGPAPGAISLAVERPGPEADHSPPYSVEVKNARSSWRGT